MVGVRGKMPTEMERRRGRTGAAPPAAPAKVARLEWVPLRRHPIFKSIRSASSCNTVTGIGKPCILAEWDSYCWRLYLWDSNSCCLHCLSVRFDDDESQSQDSILAASPSKLLYPDIQLQFPVHTISVNRTGSSLVLVGHGRLCVIYLYKRTSRNDDSVVCRTVSIASQLYSDDDLKILQVSWHPHSDTHLGVLSSDSIFRLFDLSSDIGRPEQEFYLQPDDNSRYHNAVSICPIAFSFGGEHLWDRFSVFFMFSDGLIYVLCPVAPFGSSYSWKCIEELYNDTDMSGLKSSILRAGTSSRLGTAWLEATFPEIVDESVERSISPVLKARGYVPSDSSIVLQGPLRHVPQDKVGESSTCGVGIAGSAVAFLYTTARKDSFLIIAWSSGQLRIEAIADEVQPLWKVGNFPHTRVDSSGFLCGVAMICECGTQECNVAYHASETDEESLDTARLAYSPFLLCLADIDLALPRNAGNDHSVLMFPDPLVPERLYCLHGRGVDMIVLNFFPFSYQEVGKNASAKAPTVNPIISACCSDNHNLLPLNGFIVLTDSFGNSWIAGITSTCECIVIDVKSWDTRLSVHFDGEEKISANDEFLETGPTDIISKELLVAPKVLLPPHGSPAFCALMPDSIEGRSALHHYFKLFHENYVEYGHKVYMELRHHEDHVKRIISDQIACVEGTKKMLLKVQKKAPDLDKRIKNALQGYTLLEERLQRFRNLPGVHKRPFSKAEREFKVKLDGYMELELNALRSSIETLRTRLKKVRRALPSEPPRGVRRSYVLETQIEHFKSSISRLSQINSENLEKVKLVESAIENFSG